MDLTSRDAPTLILVSGIDANAGKYTASDIGYKYPVLNRYLFWLSTFEAQLSVI